MTLPLSPRQQELRHPQLPQPHLSVTARRWLCGSLLLVAALVASWFIANFDFNIGQANSPVAADGTAKHFAGYTRTLRHYETKHGQFPVTLAGATRVLHKFVLAPPGKLLPNGECQVVLATKKSVQIECRTGNSTLDAITVFHGTVFARQISG